MADETNAPRISSVCSALEFTVWANHLAIPLTDEQVHAHRVLQGLGKKFMIDYGFQNVVAQAAVALEHASTPPRVM